MKKRLSKEIMERAMEVIPGGVNSPVRAFGAVGGTPPFIKRAKGSKVYDVDGNAYIDYVGSWGPMILGHAHPTVSSALKRAINRGTSYGAPTASEVDLANLIIDAFPTMDMVRLVSSGTEATMSAIRLARGFTGRDGILKFEGCYHGHSDSLLVKAGSGAATFGVPSSPGVPKGLAQSTFNAVYNDLGSVEAIFKKNRKGIACVIIEGVPGNMGVVLPQDGFLAGLRKLCTKYGALLIVDEVMSGFRLCYGGAQRVFDVKPDITCLGKVIGGGMPIGAFGGRRKIMEKLAPAGPVYQAGTLSGNPIAVTAGITTMKLLKKRGVYKQLIKKAEALCDGLEEITRRKGFPVQIARAGSMFTIFFNDDPVTNYTVAAKSDLDRFSKYFGRMLEGGVYLPPSQFEAAFVSTAHTDRDIDRTLEVAKKALNRL